MKARDKLILILGAVIGALTLFGGIIAMLYWLLGKLDFDGLRWYALVLTLVFPVAVFITNRLASHAAREHLAGFDRGLTGAQKTVETMGRSLSATASLARSSRPVPAQVRTDDLLPKVASMRLIESGVQNDDVIDL